MESELSSDRDHGSEQDVRPPIGGGDIGPVTTVFDLGHPAQFHLFRNTIAALKQSGNDVHIVAREKDCLPGLLDQTGWAYTLIPRRHTDLIALAIEQFRAFGAVYRLARQTKAGLLIGTSVVVGLAARLTGATSIVFSEDDADVVPLFARLAYPTAHYVVTPRCLQQDHAGKNHLTYRGFEELAYLHPDRYRPDPGIRDQLGLRADEKYFVIRRVAMKAHHDIGHHGLRFDQFRALIRRLEPHGRVFISAEGPIPRDLRPRLLDVPLDRVFDVLAFADIVISDGQTMIVEAAVLGTPALRCNTFIGRLTVLEELAGRYQLTVGFRPSQFGRMLSQLDDWLAQPNLKDEWAARRQKLLDDSVDVTEWILDLIRRLVHGEPAAPG